MVAVVLIGMSVVSVGTVDGGGPVASRWMMRCTFSGAIFIKPP